MLHRSLAVLVVACLGAVALSGAPAHANSSNDYCRTRSVLCVDPDSVNGVGTLSIWDHSPNTTDGGFPNNVELKIDWLTTAPASEVDSTPYDYLVVDIEEKGQLSPLPYKIEFDPNRWAVWGFGDPRPGCGPVHPSEPDNDRVVRCVIASPTGDDFAIRSDLGAGDDREKISISSALRLSGSGGASSILSRIHSFLRDSSGNDSIISTTISDDVDLGPGDDYADLGGVAPGGWDRGAGGGGFDTLYCDTHYQPATPTRPAYAGCTLIGGPYNYDEPAAGYSWLFGANTDDDLMVGDAGGYAYDTVGSNRFSCGANGTPEMALTDLFCPEKIPASASITSGSSESQLTVHSVGGPTDVGESIQGAGDTSPPSTSGGCPRAGGEDNVERPGGSDRSRITTIEDLVTAVLTLSGPSDSTQYPPSVRTTNSDATPLDAIIRAVDAALVGSP